MPQNAYETWNFACAYRPKARRWECQDPEQPHSPFLFTGHVSLSMFIMVRVFGRQYVQRRSRGYPLPSYFDR